MAQSARQTIFICSALESEHVARLQRLDPARLKIICLADLMPRALYQGYHKSGPHPRDDGSLARWHSGLAQADILFDLPAEADVPYAQRVRWVQTTSTGVGPAVKRLGLAGTDVVVTTARGVHARPLAEFAFMALLAHFRDLELLKTEQRERRWIRRCSREIAGRTLVIIGAGDLARGCAKLASALDMRVTAVTRDPSKARAHAAAFDEILPVQDMHGALGRADAVILTLPHTPDTENIFDRAAFAALRPGAAFVNIGRGQLVDEDALIGNLRSGRLGFAALDVTRVEPLPGDSPLWEMPNVLISPHSASTVPKENERIMDIFADNIACWLRDRPDEMKNILDKQKLY